MSERRERRKGRGLDAIFDSADLSLEPAPTRRPDLMPESAPESAPAAGTIERERDEVGERTVPAGGSLRTRRSDEFRRPGRPRGQVSQARELVQRGFYLEPDQDRMLDETKAALKGRGFTPDRSAIVRAALEHFGGLDRFDQEDLVRRFK